MSDQKAADKLDSILNRGWAVTISKNQSKQWSVTIAPTGLAMYNNEGCCSIGISDSLYDMLCITEDMVLSQWDERYSDLSKDRFGYYSI